MNSVISILLTTFFLAVAYSGPIETGNKDVFDSRDLIYTGQHDIIKIYTSIPLIEGVERRIIFFVEADINNDGSKVDKGAYVIIDNSTSKLLDSCRDIAGDANGNTFFASKDGIYAYNRKEHNTQKYGNIQESIVSIAVENNTGVIYALNEYHVLFKITENGTKYEVDDRVKHAREIITDMFDNLYYIGEDKNVYVVVDQGVKQIEGLPQNVHDTVLIKPPPGANGIFLMKDNVPYRVFSNGTSVMSEKTRSSNTPQLKPTAYSFDAIVLLYFGHDKKIYEINLIEKIVASIFDKLSQWVKDTFSFIGVS